MASPDAEPTEALDELQLPAAYQHCVKVYDAMLKECRTEEGLEVYEGFLTKLFESLGLSVPYYTQVMAALKRMRCVEQIRRGGGGSPSVWVCRQPPNPDLYKHAIEPARRNPTRLDAAAQQLRDLTRRVEALEAMVARQM